MDDAKNPFELNMENSNMLPIDQSLHAFMLQLNEGRAEKDQLTAKLVCNALGAVPKESDQAAPEDSIYQDVFKNKYDYEEGTPIQFRFSGKRKTFSERSARGASRTVS